MFLEKRDFALRCVPVNVLNDVIESHSVRASQQILRFDVSLFGILN
jgi:hypothetical protein